MGEFDDYFQEEGVSYEVTALYSSEQNEKRKRVNHIIIGPV